MPEPSPSRTLVVALYTVYCYFTLFGLRLGLHLTKGFPVSQMDSLKTSRRITDFTPPSSLIPSRQTQLKQICDLRVWGVAFSLTALHSLSQSPILATSFVMSFTPAARFHSLTHAMIGSPSQEPGVYSHVAKVLKDRAIIQFVPAVHVCTD